MHYNGGRMRFRQDGIIAHDSTLPDTAVGDAAQPGAHLFASRLQSKLETIDTEAFHNQSRWVIV